MTDVERRVAVAEEAARAGAAVAAEFFRSDLDVAVKDNKTDFVTAADRDAQRRVVEVIREAFPDDAVVGEENERAEAVPETGAAWVVDPIDGTNNFVRGIGYWATSVAAVVDGETVAAANVLPTMGDAVVSGPDGVVRNGDPVTVSGREDPDTFTVTPTYWWERSDRAAYANAAEAIVRRFGDLRRLGCAQASLSHVAAGGLEGVITNRRMHPWDSVAGVHQIRMAGGTVTDVDGDRWEPDSEGLVASNGTRHDLVQAAAQDI